MRRVARPRGGLFAGRLFNACGLQCHEITHRLAGGALAGCGPAAGKLTLSGPRLCQLLDIGVRAPRLVSTGDTEGLGP